MSPDCTSSVRRIFPTMAPTGWARARSCKGWRTAISCCPTPCRLISPARSASALRPITPSFKKPKAMFARGPRNYSRSTGSVPWIHFIANWVSCFGTSAAWRGTPPDCARRSREFPFCATNSGATSASRATAKSSINRWKGQDAIADFLEFGELMCIDALTRDESCGGHFREEHQTPDGEALPRRRKFRGCLRLGISGQRIDRPAEIASRAARLRNRRTNAEEL